MNAFMSYKFSTKNLTLDENDNDNDNENKNENENVDKQKKIYFFRQCIKMSYYQFNRQEILKKVKERYSNEKAAEYSLQNKEAIKEKARDRYENLSEEEKNKTRDIKKYQELLQYKKGALKSK